VRVVGGALPFESEVPLCCSHGGAWTTGKVRAPEDCSRQTLTHLSKWGVRECHTNYPCRWAAHGKLPNAQPSRCVASLTTWSPQP
jgi:hypothetical protein